MSNFKRILLAAFVFAFCFSASFGYSALGRGGAVAVLVVYKIYIQGGFTSVIGGNGGPGDNDMLIFSVDQSFNLSTPPWDSTSGTISDGPSLQGQIAAVGGYNNSLIYFFGGQFANISDHDINFLWSFDTTTGNWSQTLSASGVIPPPVDSHSAVARYQDSTIWVFGGENDPLNATAVFNTTWRLVTQPTPIWSIVGNYAPQGGRQAHTANLLSDGRMVILGGISFNLTIFPMTDVLIFDTNSGNWNFTTAQLQDTEPVPRLSHVSVTTYDDQIIIHGGEIGGGHLLGDIAVLDMNAVILEWYVPQAAGTQPSPRVAHNAIMAGTRMFILFGETSNNTLDNNIYVLDTSAWVWLTEYTPDHLEYTKTWPLSPPIYSGTSASTSSVPTSSPTMSPVIDVENTGLSIGEICEIVGITASIFVSFIAVIIGIRLYRIRNLRVVERPHQIHADSSEE